MTDIYGIPNFRQRDYWGWRRRPNPYPNMIDPTWSRAASLPAPQVSGSGFSGFFDDGFFETLNEMSPDLMANYAAADKGSNFQVQTGRYGTQKPWPNPQPMMPGMGGPTQMMSPDAVRRLKKRSGDLLTMPVPRGRFV